MAASSDGSSENNIDITSHKQSRQGPNYQSLPLSDSPIIRVHWATGSIWTSPKRMKLLENISPCLSECFAVDNKTGIKLFSIVCTAPGLTVVTWAGQDVPALAPGVWGAGPWGWHWPVITTSGVNISSYLIHSHTAHALDWVLWHHIRRSREHNRKKLHCLLTFTPGYQPAIMCQPTPSPCMAIRARNTNTWLWSFCIDIYTLLYSIWLISARLFSLLTVK